MLTLSMERLSELAARAANADGDAAPIAVAALDLLNLVWVSLNLHMLQAQPGLPEVLQELVRDVLRDEEFRQAHEMLLLLLDQPGPAEPEPVARPTLRLVRGDR